jgi:UDPglucose--hexose-1-phosphate uridylyltransferase
MAEVLVRYDNLFESPFPYSMGVYQAPLGGPAPDGFLLRQVFLPPLLRSATIKKFVVGYELCAEPQRDISPESAADRLRQVGSRHYRAERNTHSGHADRTGPIPASP